MDLTPYVPLMIPLSVLALAAAARVMSDLATQADARKQSKVSQVERAVARYAGGIASDLQQAKAAGSSADALAEMKAAGVNTGVAYLSTTLPGVLAKAGATPASLAQMLNGEVGGQSLLAVAPGLLAAAAAQLLPNQVAPDPAPAAAAAG